MTTVDRLIEVAKSQVGYVETGGTTGHNGNITKYWADLDAKLEGSSWCGVFVSWVWKTAGYPLPPIDRSYGYINCADAVAWAKSHKMWDADGNYKPGDIIFYSFEGNYVASHTGIVISDNGSIVNTIEGNTSPGIAGSQANGGGVYQRRRPHGPMILGVLQSSKWLNNNTITNTTNNSTSSHTSVVPMEDDMGSLCQIPNKKKVYWVYAGGYTYIEKEDGIIDLRRLGAKVDSTGHYFPIGQDTLLNLRYDGPTGRSAAENN